MKKLLFSFILGLLFLSFAFADKTITLSPGRNVVSTPQILSGINFSNGGAGIVFYTLSGDSWASIAATVENIRPLEGFVVNNNNVGNITMDLVYATDVNPMETIFQKTLNLGRNILGITTTLNPFANIGNLAVMSLDFTKNNASNLTNSVNTSFTINNTSSDITSPELGEAYGVFVSSLPAIYGGNQNGDITENPDEYGYDLETHIYCNAEIVLGNESTYEQITFSAGDQDIQINSFQLYGSGVGLYPAIASIGLYGADDEFFGIKSVNTNAVVFSGLNRTIPKGEDKIIRIKITTNKIGSGFIGIQTGEIYLGLTGINAIGLSGGVPIISPGVVSSEGLNVVPVIMNIETREVGTSLTNGINILGRFSISATSSNTRMDNGEPLKLDIDEIIININKSQDTTINNYTLQREGGTGGLLTGSIEGDYVTFDLDGWNMDNLITPQNYWTYFRIGANVLTGNDEDIDFVQISIDDITYSSDDPISDPIYYGNSLIFPALFVGSEEETEEETDECTTEELLACVTAIDYDDCIAACSETEESLLGVLNTSIYRDYNKDYVLSNSVIDIGNIEFYAENEDIQIDSFQLYGSGVGIYPTIASIVLYSGDEMIAISTVDSDMILFSGINLTIPKEDNISLGIKIVTNKIGSGEVGLQTGDIYLAITGINAIGLSGGVPIVSPGVVSSEGFSVLPGKISGVHADDGESIPLTEGINLIGRMHMTIMGDTVLINQIRIKVNKSNTTTVENYTIEKESGSTGGPQGPITGYIQGDYIVFTGIVGTYNTILSIKANVTKGIGTNFVQAYIEDLSNGDITYSFDTPIGYPITNLKLYQTSLDFPGLY